MCNVCLCALVHGVQLSVTPWTVVHQSPLSMQFFRQEYWSGLPFPTLGDLPNPGIEPGVSFFSWIGRWIFTTGATREAHWIDGGPTKSVENRMRSRFEGEYCGFSFGLSSLEDIQVEIQGCEACEEYYVRDNRFGEFLTIYIVTEISAMGRLSSSFSLHV